MADDQNIIAEARRRFAAVAEINQEFELQTIKNVLFLAGPQWGDRSPDDIINALDAAGYMIVRKLGRES